MMTRKLDVEIGDKVVVIGEAVAVAGDDVVIACGEGMTAWRQIINRNTIYSVERKPLERGETVRIKSQRFEGFEFEIIAIAEERAWLKHTPTADGSPAYMIVNLDALTRV
jgi:hypothetical protein